MKFRNQFLKYKLFCVDEDGGGGGGGDNSANAGGNDNGNDAGKNNANDNSPNYDDLWHTGSNDDADTQQKQAQTVVVQQAATPSAEESFNKHLEGLDLGFDNTAYNAALQNQDYDSADKIMLENNRRVYKSAMVNLNSVINTRMDQMRKEMQENTQTTLQSNEVISEMQKSLPFTKQPRYDPIARAVLKQWLEKGKTSEEAIKETGNYFRSLADDVSSTLQKPPGDKPRGGFNNYDNDGNQNTDEELDWIDFLGGAPNKAD